MPALLRSRAVAVILAILCAWLVLLASGATLRSLAARRELAALEGQIDDQRRGNERLERQVQRMREPSWLALLARQRLNWRAPDETVVFVYKSEKSDTIVPPQAVTDTRPNWRRWWDWLIGSDGEAEASSE